MWKPKQPALSLGLMAQCASTSSLQSHQLVTPVPGSAAAAGRKEPSGAVTSSRLIIRFISLRLPGHNQGDQRMLMLPVRALGAAYLFLFFKVNCFRSVHLLERGSVKNSVRLCSKPKRKNQTKGRHSFTNHVLILSSGACLKWPRAESRPVVTLALRGGRA